MMIIGVTILLAGFSFIIFKNSKKDVLRVAGRLDEKVENNELAKEEIVELLNPIKAGPVNNQDLDKLVLKEAKRLGKDAKSYRMLIKQEPDGGKIYRQMGMFIIVNPNGKEAYLPDEI